MQLTTVVSAENTNQLPIAMTQFAAQVSLPPWAQAGCLLSAQVLNPAMMCMLSAVLCAGVWCAAGYSKEEGQQHPYPVLYCNDGQNVFGDCQTLSGNSWRVAQTAAELIQTGRLPPFMVVGLDHAGPLRSLEYTPYAPGTGPGGFRCAQHTGPHSAS